MTLDEAIKHCEEVAELNEECTRIYDEHGRTMESFSCKECAVEHRQLAEWLRELQRYRFEISECKAILDNPTPDVTENDKKRTMFVLQTFPDVRGDEI
jgi:hypothetical protein